MARSVLMAALLMACLCGSALAFPIGTTQATLNVLNQQTTISLDQTEQNPYGLYPITHSKGNLVAGHFLATNWNSADGMPGQGRTILQITPDGCQTAFATIEPTNPIIAANCNGTVGVGLTMALVVLSRGYVVVGSTPVASNGVAAPGCLIVLDSKGTVLDAHHANELTTSNTKTGGGPWGMAVQESNFGRQASLFVSYVLGDNPMSMATLSGVHGGMVVRYGLLLPGGNVATTFWGPKPEVIARGFPTQPGNIAGGAVGPSGLFVGSPTPSVPNAAYRRALQHQPLFIANTLNSSLDVVYQSTSCFSITGTCKLHTSAWGGLLNGPVGIAQSPAGTIVGANGGIGYLFEVAPTSDNTQLALQLVDNQNNAGVAGAGDLFNVMFHPMSPNMLFFNDDGFNSFNVLAKATVRARCPSHGRKMV